MLVSYMTLARLGPAHFALLGLLGLPPVLDYLFGLLADAELIPANIATAGARGKGKLSGWCFLNRLVESVVP